MLRLLTLALAVLIAGTSPALAQSSARYQGLTRAYGSGGGGGGTSGTIAGADAQVGVFSGTNAMVGYTGFSYNSTTVSLFLPAGGSGFRGLSVNGGTVSFGYAGSGAVVLGGGGRGAGLFVNGNSGSPSLYSASSGDVGIGLGLLQPQAKLHVSGTAIIGGNSSVSPSTATLDVYGDVSSSGNLGGATFQAGNGSTSTASYGFSGNVNTGMYRSALNRIGFTANGVKALELNQLAVTTSLAFQAASVATTGNANISGTMTIGNGTSSAAGLDVYGDISSSTRLLVNGTRIQPANTSSLYINSTGSPNGTGNQNTGVGVGNLAAISSGGGNTAIGAEAMVNLSGSDYNTAVGYRALRLATGLRNTAIGTFAASTQTTGNDNIFIGQGVAPVNTTGSNQLNIGNAIYGDLANSKIGIGNVSPTANLEVSGTVRFTGVGVPCTASLTGAERDSTTYNAKARCNGTNWIAYATTTIVVPAATP